MKRLQPTRDVRARLGNVGNTKFYEMIRDGEFPPPIKLPSTSGAPGRASYWDSDVVDEWIAARTAAQSAALRAHLAELAEQRLSDPFGRRPTAVVRKGELQ
jgi:predicted DNA-binding transcriptional regulator AlpA